MAYITKRGSSYGVRYTYQDEQGKNCNKWESFSTKEEATNRKKQIEHKGRKKAALPDSFPALYTRYTRWEMTKGQLAEALHVTRPTLERMIREHLETTARI